MKNDVGGMDDMLDGQCQEARQQVHYAIRKAPAFASDACLHLQLPVGGLPYLRQILEHLSASVPHDKNARLE